MRGESQLTRRVPDSTHKVTASFDELSRDIRRIGCGLVIIDGCRGAGKTHLTNELATKLGCAAIELDCLWDKEKPGYVAAMKLGELSINLTWGKSWSKLVLVNGLYVREILKALNEVFQLSVYVQNISRNGLLSDCELIDVENNNPTHSLRNELNNEVLLYH